MRLALGKIRFLFPENPKVLAFVTQYQEETILVLANLSRFSEYIELDLSEWQGMRLLELFGQTSFPEITTLPYFVTLNSHSFYWFLIEKFHLKNTEISESEKALPVIEINDWENLIKKENGQKLEKILPHYLSQQRWFGAKTQKIKSIKVTDSHSIFAD